jgi:NitT/TauT family transport system permease protein
MTDLSLKTKTDATDKSAAIQTIGRQVRPAAMFLIGLLLILFIWQAIKIVFQLSDLQLPGALDVIGALFQPIQSGQPALGMLLLQSALYTMREAAAGFVIGSLLGFALAVVFAHSRLLERGLLPFVVASQTVPILAIAPMVVVWLGPTAQDAGAPWVPVAVITAYLTFFPVTINSLRGLISVQPTALELMHSYAATRREILFKLRIPHALPYIFTALKISATGSVVGAIIGELPSGIQHGLGSDILTFSQYYIQGPARLWATNVAAAICGVLAFVVIALAERLIVRWQPSHSH